jgi:hypothetical protein
MRELVAMQEEKNRQVMQSIDYASVIQRAMLSAARGHDRGAGRCLPGLGTARRGRRRLLSFRSASGWLVCRVADCTGHGVPGAFLT